MTQNDKKNIDFEQIINDFYLMLSLIRQGYTSEIALSQKLLNCGWSDLNFSCLQIRRFLQKLLDQKLITTSYMNRTINDSYKPITIFKLTRKGMLKLESMLKIINKQNDNK